MLSEKSIKAKTMDEFRAELVASKYNTAALRKLIPIIAQHYEGNVQYISDQLDLDITHCDVCGEVSYANKTISAYHGAYWVCEDCMPRFGVCKPCGTYVLLPDLLNPSHKHANFNFPGVLYFPDNEVQVAVYNADIMDGHEKQRYYFRTAEEVMSASRSAQLGKLSAVPRYFGVELEVEKVSGAPPDLTERTRDTLGQKFVMLKHDGSLSRHGKNGFEIVSMPATMAYHKGGAWDDFYENLGEFFEEGPVTTGLHIHIGVATILPITIGRMLMFVNAAKNKEFICDVARRQLDIANPNGKTYAGLRTNWKPSDLLKLKQHRPDCPWNLRNQGANNRYAVDPAGAIRYDVWGNPIIARIIGSPSIVRRSCKCEPGVYNLHKYEALNIMTKRPTIELRIFRGIVQQSFLYAALEFCDALIDYCADSSMSTLDYQSFLNWICQGRRKIYRNLFRHLVNLGWIDPPKAFPELGVVAVPYQNHLIDPRGQRPISNLVVRGAEHAL